MEIGAQFPPGTRVTQVPFGRQGSCELKLPERISSAKCHLLVSLGSFFVESWCWQGVRLAEGWWLCSSCGPGPPPVWPWLSAPISRLEWE